MVAGAAAIALSARDNFGLDAAAYRRSFGISERGLGEKVQARNDLLPQPASSGPFLRVPPFPGCKVHGLEGPASDHRIPDRAEAQALVDLVRKLRVGGTYWARQPDLPNDYILVLSSDGLRGEIVREAGSTIVLWTSGPHFARTEATTIIGECDPWHVLAGAKALFLEKADTLCIIAAILGVPTYLMDSRSGTFKMQHEDAASLLGKALAGADFVNPFTREGMSPREAIELCGFWRALVDSNRAITGALGFAFWKRDNVAPLLWGGSEPVSFEEVPAPSGDHAYAVWRSRTPVELIAALEASGAHLFEVEDGFLRSQGLGADCVPPLSITLDRLGAYFDPSGPSEIEGLLQQGEFDEELLERARTLRSVIVEAGLGKYEIGGAPLERPAGDRRHILVPGQVEDDRSVLTGGCGLVSNLDLLKRVREQAPDAYILYKPHPDVIAGHRSGFIPEKDCLEFADGIVIDVPISSLIDMVDEVHVNTSLAGFEALLREKPVTTYGVPFYAGWGLTRDLGPVPSRRGAGRTMDELVAATLLMYPRYLDPVTGLPCPAEIVVRRLVERSAKQEGMVVSMRRLQGRVMRRLRELAR